MSTTEKPRQVLRALELRSSQPRPASSVHVVIDSVGIAIAREAEDDLRQLIAGMASVRDSLEYADRVSPTPHDALEGKREGPMYRYGAMWAAGCVAEVSHLGNKWLGMSKDPRSVERALLLLAIWRLLDQEELSPTEIHQRLSDRGYDTTLPSVSKALTELLGSTAGVGSRGSSTDRRRKLFSRTCHSAPLDAPEGLDELVQAIGEATENPDDFVMIVNEVGRVLAERPRKDLSAVIDALQRWGRSGKSSTAEAVLSDPHTAEPFLAGALWSATDIAGSFLTRVHATAERRAARASRAEAREAILQVLNSREVARPADFLHALADQQLDSTPQQISAALSDLLRSGGAEPADAPAGADGRNRYYCRAQS